MVEAAPAPELADAADTAVDNREGNSRISDSRSTLRATCMAFFLRSRAALSVILLYLVENLTASSSSLGMASRNCCASWVNLGMEVRRVERWSAEVMKAR